MKKSINSVFKSYLLCVIAILLTSCSAVQLKYSTINHDPIYDNNGKEVKINTINNEYELARKFRTDDTFRWNFAQYAMNQNMRWHYDFYWNNRMFRRSVFSSPFNYYWNSQQYWWNWASNSPFNMRYNHWDPFGFNNYGWGSRYYGYGYSWNNYYGWNGYSSPWNNWGYRQRMNDYAWRNRNRTNTAYVVGRRSSSNVVVGNRTNIENRIIVNRNKPRLVVDKDVVLDKAILKLKGNNNNVRVYENPNNVPNKIIIRRNNNNKPVRNYNRPENNRNNFNRNNNSRPNRNYSTPTRSSTPPATSRKSGGKAVIKK